MEEPNRSLKRHMNRSSHCPINITYHFDVEIMGQLWLVVSVAPLLSYIRQIQGLIESILGLRANSRPERVIKV